MAITLETFKAVQNGAQFYTADLHIHSYGASGDVSDPEMTVENIIEGAVAAGISLLSITDHNNDGHVEASLEYGSRYAGRLLVLPGVEITTANGHLLAFFPPDRARAVRDLLARVKIIGDYGARDSHTAMSMADVIAEAERLGGLSIAAHVDRQDNTGFEMSVSGYPNWKKDLLLSPGLHGLEFDEVTHLGWYSEDDELTDRGAERKKLVELRRKSAGSSARPSLAHIQDSDAHTLEQFRTQLAGGAATRFKMNELTFDGLRTSLIDPDARVRAVATLPPTVPKVLGMYTTGGFLDTSVIRFSNNLNCFIGGRGTGKSTAIKSLAYGLGARDELAGYDNCPDQVVVYCEDADGVLYRYERNRSQAPTVRAKEDQSPIRDVPVDAFRVEFYGQGHLADVAKDPLTNPTLLQDFLDRHITLRDLGEREVDFIRELEENSAQLIPVEASAAQLPGKTTAAEGIDKKLKIAETGKVKEIAAFQAKLSAEKSIVDGLVGVEDFYRKGITMTPLHRSYPEIAKTAGTATGQRESEELLTHARTILDKTNALLDDKAREINDILGRQAASLATVIKGLKDRHKAHDEELSVKIAELQKQGLSGNVQELGRLVEQRRKLSAEIMKINNQRPQLDELRGRRHELLEGLKTVRNEMGERRKAQLRAINQNLARVIEDYTVAIYYDKAGIVDDFCEIVDSVMHGSYFQRADIRALCASIAPGDLANMVAAGDIDGITRETRITAEWAREVVKRFSSLNALHKLEIAAKPERPVIRVVARGSTPQEVPVTELSDGQKHTILLTVAMLAESNVPLIIDQPEDDLDNAFIFRSVVRTLRAIKERRQVVLVTHNANIAVLGDSELLLPMKRVSGAGTVVHRGSIDASETRREVQDILEGGEMAFRRRKEIYGY